jgi:hypothetical protein
MTAHSHSAGNLHAGTYADKSDRPDSMFGPAGSHFTAMVHTAPVLKMNVPHFVTACPSCNAWIKWSHSGGNGECKGCGVALTTHPESGFPVPRLQGPLEKVSG